MRLQEILKLLGPHPASDCAHMRHQAKLEGLSPRARALARDDRAFHRDEPGGEAAFATCGVLAVNRAGHGHKARGADARVVPFG